MELNCDVNGLVSISEDGPEMKACADRDSQTYKGIERWFRPNDQKGLWPPAVILCVTSIKMNYSTSGLPFIIDI